MACGWYGIQSWFGGMMIYALLGVLVGHPLEGARIPALGINLWQAVCFLVFWLLQFYFIVHGIESIRRLETYTALIKIVICVMLLFWAYDKAGGFGPIVRSPSQFGPGGARSGQFHSVFWPSLRSAMACSSSFGVDSANAWTSAPDNPSLIASDSSSLRAP